MRLSKRETAMLRAVENMTDHGKDEVLFDKEAVFPNGMRVAIRYVAADELGELPWAEAVAFDEAGCECGCTDIDDTVFGEWELYIGAHEYVVNVVPDEEVAHA